MRGDAEDEGGGASSSRGPQRKINIKKEGAEKEKGKDEADGSKRLPNRKRKPDSIELLDLLPGMLKNQLQINQHIRQLQGLSITTFLLKAESALVVEAQLAGLSYASQVKEDGPGHKWGPPHPHIFMASMEGLAKEVREHATYEHKAEFLTAVEAILQINMVQAADIVLYWQVKQCYQPPPRGADKTTNKAEEDLDAAEVDNKQARLSFAINPMMTTTVPGLAGEGPILAWKIKTLLMNALIGIGGNLKQGPPPRGELERLMQTLLKKVQGHAR